MIEFLQSNMAPIMFASLVVFLLMVIMMGLTVGTVAGIAYRGNGDCAASRPDFPEKGLSAVRCTIQLRGLPGEYTGGLKMRLRHGASHSPRASLSPSCDPSWVLPLSRVASV